jgi:hypothetical protein
MGSAKTPHYFTARGKYDQGNYRRPGACSSKRTGQLRGYTIDTCLLRIYEEFKENDSVQRMDTYILFSSDQFLPISKIMQGVVLQFPGGIGQS